MTAADWELAEANAIAVGELQERLEQLEAERDAALRVFREIAETMDEPTTETLSYYIEELPSTARAWRLTREAEGARLRAAASHFVGFLTFIEAGREIDGEEPLSDGAIVASYMGPGASDALRIGDFRVLRAALRGEKDDAEGDV